MRRDIYIFIYNVKTIRIHNRATSRELNAIESENAKNLQNDGFRAYQLEKSRANPLHPFSKVRERNRARNIYKVRERYSHTYTQRETDRDTQTYTQRETERDTHTHAHTHTEP